MHILFTIHIHNQPEQDNKGSANDPIPVLQKAAALVSSGLVHLFKRLEMVLQGHRRFVELLVDHIMDMVHPPHERSCVVQIGRHGVRLQESAKVGGDGAVRDKLWEMVDQAVVDLSLGRRGLERVMRGHRVQKAPIGGTPYFGIHICDPSPFYFGEF